MLPAACEVVLQRAGEVAAAVGVVAYFVAAPFLPSPAPALVGWDAGSLALLGLRSPGVELTNPDCVAKTYPQFFEHLARLGA